MARPDAEPGQHPSSMLDGGRNGAKRTRNVVCVGCRSSSSLRWRGWQAHHADHPVSFEPAELVFYCPACAFGEFGPIRRSAREEND